MAGGPDHYSEKAENAGQTDMQPQTCTDIICLLIFLAFMGGMGYVTVHGFQKGDLRRLNHGYQWDGALCGVDPSVEGTPYLYWCGDPGKPNLLGIPTGLNLKSPICVSECPSDMNVTLECKDPTTATEGLAHETDYKDHLDTVANNTITLSEPVTEQKSYPSKLIMGKYCVPDVGLLSDIAKVDMTQVLDSLTNSSGPIGSGSTKILDEFGSLKRVWPLFVGSAITALILGYAFLLLLKCLAKILVYTILITFMLIFIICGCYFCAGYVLTGDNLVKWEDNNPFYKEHLALKDAQLYSAILGGILIAIGLIIALLTFCAKRSIDMAIGCVEAACDCLFSLPSLLLMPIVETFFKALIFCSCMFVLMYLVSAGELQTGQNFQINGQEVGGLRRSFTYTDEQKYMIAYYIFGIFWLLEIVNAAGQFAVSYAVVSWYYTPIPKKNVPNCLTGKGVCLAVTYHIGTIAFGAFLIAVCRFARLIASILSQEEKAKGNVVMQKILECLMCLVTCIEKCIAFINKNAYIDVAINSNPFCVAAKDAFEFISRETIAITLLNGACYLFVIAGTILVSCGTAFSAYSLITTNERWTSESSAHHVASPLFVAAIIGIMAGFIAHSFMVVFDHTADTLLYTFCWNKDHGHNTVPNFAPPGLQKVVEYKKKEKPKGGEAKTEKPGFWSSFFGSSKAASKSEETKPLVAADDGGHGGGHGGGHH